MSKVISGRRPGDFAPWRAPSVDGPVVGTAGSGSGAPGGPGLLTAKRVEAIQREAYREGFERGRQEGAEAGRAEFQARVAQLEAVMRTLSEPVSQLDESVERELVQLSLAVARHLVRREISMDPGQIVAVVREAVAALPSAAGKVRLHLHPDDAVVVKERMALPESERNWEVVDDPSLTRGGCRVNSDISHVDASLESRLNAVVARLMGGERQGDSAR